MVNVKALNPGLVVRHEDGRKVAGFLADDGRAVCYELTDAGGEITRLAISHESLAAMVVIRQELLDGSAASGVRACSHPLEVDGQPLRCKHCASGVQEDRNV
jgi:hypothetical protein